MDERYYTDPVLLAQKLIRFDTTTGVNPELPCIMFIKELFDGLEIETELLSRDPKRPNLLAHIPAKAPVSGIPPILLYGHVDVVSTSDQEWSEDPFAGTIKDGYLWGRGAIDMKGEHAMLLTAIFNIVSNHVELPYDIYYLAVSDEEGDSDYGLKYLVETYPERFSHIKYAIGEIGGFSLTMSGKKMYPIQIAEKQIARIKITAEGEGGHASMKHTDTAVSRLGEAITKLSNENMPVRITEPVRCMITALSKALGGLQGAVLKQLLKPSLTNKVLKLLGNAGSLFDPLLHNSLNVTILGGGDAINVIPSKVWCQCDLRMVPECSIEDAVSDIKSVIGDRFKIEVLSYDYGAQGVDMTLYESMAAAIEKADPDGYPVPFVLAAVTDGRFLSRVGIQSYGFTPMDLPEDYDFTDMAHNADERVPVDALVYGSERIYDYLLNFYEEGCHGK